MVKPQRYRSRENRQVGFSLIEMLVVISVIALLLSLALPSYHHAKELSRSAVCKTNLHGVGTAIQAYLNDSGDIMPVATRLPSEHLNDDPRIADVLAGYLTSPQTLHCPSDTEKNYFESEGSSYEYNTWLGGRRFGQDRLSKRIGEARVPVMYDYEPFHGKAGTAGAANYLFLDGHVGDIE